MGRHARFSTVASEAGGADKARDPLGFALKFYTDEGNYDLVGNNTPVSFIRDGIDFPDFIRSQKRLPGDHPRSNDMQWYFLPLSPESAHQVTILMSDRGIPASRRQTDGFGSHTFQRISASGERFWIEYHFKSRPRREEQHPGRGRHGCAERPRRPLRDLSDADRHRVGTNYSELPVKAAHSDESEFSGHPTA